MGFAGHSVNIRAWRTALRNRRSISHMLCRPLGRPARSAAPHGRRNHHHTASRTANRRHSSRISSTVFQSSLFILKPSLSWRSTARTARLWRGDELIFGGGGRRQELTLRSRLGFWVASAPNLPRGPARPANNHPTPQAGRVLVARALHRILGRRCQSSLLARRLVPIYQLARRGTSRHFASGLFIGSIGICFSTSAILCVWNRTPRSLLVPSDRRKFHLPSVHFRANAGGVLPC
jgi:hypothetical protein